MKYYFVFAVTAISIALAACKKDDTTCGVQVAVTDTLNYKLKHKWVVFDIPPNTPPSQTGNSITDELPLALNTGSAGFVETTFSQPAIIQASIYDSADTQFLTPLKIKIIQLKQAETVSYSIEIQ